MKVLNEYTGRHHYIENFEKTKYFCPNCGCQDVWEEQSPGDYYVGAEYICSICGADWTMQGVGVCDEARMKNKVEQLKTGITLEPTTRKGG